MRTDKPRMRVDHSFEEIHIKQVWAELHDRFGFNVAEWKKKYFVEWNQHRSQDEMGFFSIVHEQACQSAAEQNSLPA